MSTESSSRREQPSTYFVQDRHNKAERERVTLQDQMFTQLMGGVLPEQPDPTLFSHILDVGCGTGHWLVEAAQTYPIMKTLVGIDISSRMIEYAQALAKEQGVSDRVEFKIMDVLRRIEFPQGYFDLLNHRMGWGYLRTWDWPNLIQEYRRVTRSGGVIRISETAAFGETNSPAGRRLCDIGREAFFNAGHLFTKESDGLTSKLAEILHQQGLKNVQIRKVLMDQSTEPAKENSRLAFRNMLPFLKKWTKLPSDYEQIYQQAMKEIDQPDYKAEWEMVTVWGTNPQ
jgi:ubiquinone/menaquinone biosynthesis C-methylase UbiE